MFILSRIQTCSPAFTHSQAINTSFIIGPPVVISSVLPTSRARHSASVISVHSARSLATSPVIGFTTCLYMQQAPCTDDALPGEDWGETSDESELCTLLTADLEEGTLLRAEEESTGSSGIHHPPLMLHSANASAGVLPPNDFHC